MNTTEMCGKLQKWIQSKAVLPLLGLGLLLLLLPVSAKEAAEPAAQSPGPRFSLEREEARLREGLSSIEGAGEVLVLLAVSGDGEIELAQSGGETLVVDAGSGREAAVELGCSYPAYTGAVVVCSGADRPAVRLNVVQAVAAYTGLGSDKITVLKMK